MLGKRERGQRTLFIPGSMDDFIPDDHILKRVNKVLDLSWLQDDVRDSYCDSNGRPSIDPEAALRLMLAGLFHNIVHDRALMREAQVNIAIRWFAGYQLDEALPDHSSLTRIRQRWGSQRFERIFRRTVADCIKAGLVDGKMLHVDATLIRADVSWESLTTQYAERVWRENSFEAPQGDAGADDEGRDEPAHRVKKRSKTDPDATMTTNNRNCRLEPSYKQHTTVDDKVGVIVDVETTTGETSEGTRLVEGIERAEAATGKKVEVVTGDAGYGHPKNYSALEERGTEAVIPPAPECASPKHMPLRRFRYDARHARVRCPAGRWMTRSSRSKSGWIYRARGSDCRRCRLRARCVPPSASARTVCIIEEYEALLRARRKRRRWDEVALRRYNRHRWRVEGAHGEAKTRHGLRRAVRRGLANVAIQVYLVAAVMNLKRLAMALLLSVLACLGRCGANPKRTSPTGRECPARFGRLPSKQTLGMAVA